MTTYGATQMTLSIKRRGFTLVELLVVIGMLAVIMGAVGSGFSAAQERAREQKATTEVKAIAQAILAYENYAVRKGASLPQLNDEDADEANIGFLLGAGETYAQGQKIPTLLMGDLKAGRPMMDPWGMPYKVKIISGSDNVQLKKISSTLETRYYFPNLYRLSKEERQ